jgi:HD superfamily phosphohydrolase
VKTFVRSHQQAIPAWPLLAPLVDNDTWRMAVGASASGRSYEIRDPVHIFVHADPDELAVIDSRPFQRLRHIHQLALTYLIYPGTTHRRFEHSLGVMHLAGRIFDVVTNPENLTDAVREVLPRTRRELEYWRAVLRMAALCHDLGHLPFSHAAEELFPNGMSHEGMSRVLILSDEMADSWRSMRPRPEPEDVAKIAIGPEKAPELTFDTWEAILAEMIVGDVFGADRMDYLLRDSLHAGVAYGRFDYDRLIQTIRILTPPPSPNGTVDDGEEAEKASLGVVRGGLESAEALLIARYFMFSQVYYHKTRLIYDIHLKDFLQAWLSDQSGVFGTEVPAYLEVTDNEIISAIRKAASNSDDSAHEPARRIANREHFRAFYERTPDDVNRFPEAGRAIYEAAKREFGGSNVRYADARKPPGTADFTVLQAGQSISSLALSDVLNKLPQPRNEYVFIVPEKRDEANKWLRENRTDVLDEAASKEREQEEER